MLLSIDRPPPMGKEMGSDLLGRRSVATEQWQDSFVVMRNSISSAKRHADLSTIEVIKGITPSEEFYNAMPIDHNLESSSSTASTEAGSSE